MLIHPVTCLALGDSSLGNCTFQNGYQYCGQYWYGDVASSDDNSTDSGEEPMRDGTLTNCTEYLDVWNGSGYTCADILSLYDITIAQFYAWNTDVGEDCSGLWLGMHTPAPEVVRSEKTIVLTTDP